MDIEKMIKAINREFEEKQFKLEMDDEDGEFRLQIPTEVNLRKSFRFCCDKLLKMTNK